MVCERTRRERRARSSASPKRLRSNTARCVGPAQNQKRACRPWRARRVTRCLRKRLARANAAVEVLTDGADRYLTLTDRNAPLGGYDARAFASLPEEIRLRLLKRAIDCCGHEGPAELGKVEALLATLDRAASGGQT